MGENNAGKSNVIDACRLLFEPEAGPRSRRWITGEDFAHDGTGVRTAAEEAEELRIAFVALTRARRFCALALPDDSPVEVIDAFQGAGFLLAGTG